MKKVLVPTDAFNTVCNAADELLEIQNSIPDVFQPAFDAARDALSQ